MSRIKSKNTSPELIVRKFLFNKGFRYRVHYKLVGKPDIVFGNKKIAIFVNGCFWHMHGCKNSVLPKTGRKFWKNKLEGNVKRDKKIERNLKKDGWSIYKIWECELEKNPEKSLEKIIKFFKK